MSSSECSENGVSYAKTRLLEIFSRLEDTERNAIEEWISSSVYREELQKLKSFQKEESELKKIATKLRKELNFDAEMRTEKIIFPTVGSFSDISNESTCHFDEFLYDDEQLEKLVEKGEISRHYCVSCGSKNTKRLSMVSHSLSSQLLLYIFKVMLPKDLSNKQLLDIGSRLGAVLYGAYHLSSASKIIGIEMNKEMCDLQEKTIKHFNYDSDRIKVVNSDIMKEKEIIQNSNVIIINTFDFFVEQSKQIEMWTFFRTAMRKGTIIVTVRSIVETLNGLGVYEDFLDWLIDTPVQQIENEIFFDLEEENGYSDLYLYTVK